LTGTVGSPLASVTERVRTVRGVRNTDMSCGSCGSCSGMTLAPVLRGE